MLTFLKAISSGLIFLCVEKKHLLCKEWENF